jgi:hypothetical protein
MKIKEPNQCSPFILLHNWCLNNTISAVYHVFSVGIQLKYLKNIAISYTVHSHTLMG